MRKIGVALLAVWCCVALCGCTHWWELFSHEEAAETSVTAVSAVPPVTVTVEGGSVEVGDTVILPVTVNADAHLVDADIFLRYDPTLLEPVLQYDAATDSERYAEPGIFEGTVCSEKTEDGCVYVLLATADDGTTAKGTLFYAAFRLLSDKAEGATVTPEISSCHVRANGADADAVAAGVLSVKTGTILPKAPEATETATETATAAP